MPDDDLRLDRRTLLATGAAGALLAQAPLSAAPALRRFPANFRWGAATAGHQIEGNNVNSDLWVMENLSPSPFKERSGDACDSYHRWREDIALLKAIGLNSYRMSIEWARIEPTPGQFSIAELDHYKRIVAELRAAGIDPVITFIHSAAPRWFAQAGGWLNPDSPKLFARYCDKAARALGDGIAYACTINEPQVSLTFRAIPMAAAYFKAQDARQLAAHAAAARATGSERFVTTDYPDIAGMTPLLMAAHEQGFAAIKAALPRVPTGVTLNLIDFAPANEGSKVDELRQLAFGGWMDVARRTGDFVGVQTYSQMRIPGPGARLPEPPPPPMPEASDPRDAGKQPVALRNTVEYAHRQTGKPVFVTENGFQTDNDARRAWYIPRVLAELHEAIASGVPVIGYMHWSLLDNFEWLQGYGPKFGLASVDHQTFKRRLKPSAAVYRDIVRQNAVSAG
jgi:beta-glucosidase